MNVTHRNRVLFWSHVPIFMIQTLVKIGKLAPILTHLYCVRQIFNRMVKVNKLRPLQTWLTIIVPNKHPSQARTLKLHVNLRHNHHRDRVTPLQRLKPTILLPGIIRKTNLVILEAADTIYVPIQILIIQKYTDIDVCKILFQPFSCAIFTLYFFAIFRTHRSNLFFFREHIHTHIHQLKLTKMQHST